MSALNKYQQLLTITSEECGELIQVCAKMMRWNTNETTVTEKEWQKLIEEVGDVFCMIELMVETGLLEWEEIYDRSDIKKEKLKKWSTLIKKEVRK